MRMEFNYTLKLKMVKNNYPCFCGHSRINHGLSAGHMPKILRERVYTCGVRNCDCEQFIPDNLKYLENKSGSK